ncbi:hypothetical protein KHQ81_00825 [Mycoplasmatota bacterium]|nr:hypothetical protein KHQ81_00825 [Mycoplasmatota bacterium]
MGLPKTIQGISLALIGGIGIIKLKSIFTSKIYIGFFLLLVILGLCLYLNAPTYKGNLLDSNLNDIEIIESIFSSTIISLRGFIFVLVGGLGIISYLKD